MRLEIATSSRTESDQRLKLNGHHPRQIHARSITMEQYQAQTINLGLE